MSYQRLSFTEKKTSLALIVSSLLGEPLAAFVAILPFILRKELAISTPYIAIVNMIKPALSLFAFYWAAFLWQKKQTLKSNWMTASLLARLPFLLFPFVNSPLYFILALSFFYFFQKGSIPAYMEVLKRSAPSEERDAIFSLSSAANFVLSIIMGLFLGPLLDQKLDAWKMLFFAGGFTGLLSILIQSKIPVVVKDRPSSLQGSFFKTPWKESWALLQKRKDFAQFQLGFMLGGIGLMLTMPALVIYAADDLNITHSVMTLSRFVWMGLGFVISIPFWRKMVSYQLIFSLTSLANFLFCLASILWTLSSWYLPVFYIAFFIYGIAQAASHLSWHLSGPIFAGEDNSIAFSTVNILTVGLRGIFVPVISTILCEMTAPFYVLILGAIFCLVGAFYLAWVKKQHPSPSSFQENLTH